MSDYMDFLSGRMMAVEPGGLRGYFDKDGNAPRRRPAEPEERAVAAAVSSGTPVPVPTSVARPVAQLSGAGGSAPRRPQPTPALRSTGSVTMSASDLRAPTGDMRKQLAGLGPVSHAQHLANQQARKLKVEDRPPPETMQDLYKRLRETLADPNADDDTKDAARKILRGMGQSLDEESARALAKMTLNGNAQHVAAQRAALRRPFPVSR